MANPKQVFLPYYSSGATTLYARVLNPVTGFMLDYADGVFRAAPATPNIPLTEYSGTPSVYYFTEARTAWIDGEYNIFGYTLAGYLFAGADLFLLNDVMVSQADLLEYMELIKKIEEGNWELVGNKWIYYDTDGVTPLIQFNVFDSNGTPSMVNVYKRTRT